MSCGNYAVFCPKAFAGIGATLPDTVMDRAIPVELHRRAPDERHPARFRQASARAELSPLRDRIAAWATVAKERLTDAEPELPDELSDRQQDSWEPLLAVADLAGGEWPERARDCLCHVQVDRRASRDALAAGRVGIEDVYGPTDRSVDSLVHTVSRSLGAPPHRFLVLSSTSTVTMAICAHWVPILQTRWAARAPVADRDYDVQPSGSYVAAGFREGRAPMNLRPEKALSLL